MALGNNTTIHGATNSVAIGSDSQVMPSDIKNDTHGVVSFGNSDSDGFKRRLINVADGKDTSDAATVGQLNASAGDVSKLEGSGIKHRVDGDLEEVDNLTDAVIQNHKDISSAASRMDDFSRSGIMAGGTDASTRSAGGNSIQLGNQSRAEGQQSVAIGAYAKAYGEDTKADMTTRRKNNATALGYTAMAGNYDTVAVGTTAKATGENASAFGSGAKALSAGSTAIGQGALADQSENATVLGQGAQAVKASNAVVLGQGAKANAGGAVVLGSNTANGQASTLIGIGNESHANATNSIAIGGANKVLGAYSMAFGYQAGAGANPVGDQKAASNAMAFGTGTQAFADDSIAMGTDASISGAQAAGSVVIGKNSYSAAANSVALGADSQVWKEDVLDSDSMGVISVGDSDKKNGTRRIINVKDGINDSDAATVKQIKAIDTKVGTADFTGTNYAKGTKDVTTAITGVDTQVKANADVLKAYKEAGIVAGTVEKKPVFLGSVTAEGNLVMGDDAKVIVQGALGKSAAAKNNIVIGKGAYIRAQAQSGKKEVSDSIAIGTGANVVANNSVAIGKDSSTMTENAVAIGNSNFQRKLQYVADGYLADYSTEAVNGRQLYAEQQSAVHYDTKKGTNAWDQEITVNDYDNLTFKGENGTTLKNVADIELAGKSFKAAGLMPGTIDDTSSVSTAIGGSEIKRNSSSSVAIGQYATVDGGQKSTVIGQGAGSYARNGTAIGQGAEVWGNNAMAIGQNSSVSIHTGTKPVDSIALGTNALVDGASNSIALGTNSQVQFGEDNTVSFGSSADSTTPDGKTVKAFTRRLTNVADGINDSDAATVGQIKTITGVDTTKGAAVQYDDTSKNAVTFKGIKGTSLNNVSDIHMKVSDLFSSTPEERSFQDAGLVPGKSNSEYSTAIGRTSFGNPNVGTNSDMSVAIGDSANIGVNAQHSVALGYNSTIGQDAAQSVMIGTNGSVSKKESIAIGEYSQVSTQNGIAIGTSNNIQSGAVNSIAIGGLYRYSEEGGTGGGNSYMVDVNAKDSVVIGAAGLSQSAGATVLGTGARVSFDAEHSVALGEDSEVMRQDLKETDTHGVVSVGNANAGSDSFTRRIINVADGKADSDAATYGQLKKVSDQVTGLNDLAVTYTDKTKTAVNFNQAALNNVGDVNFQMKGGSRGLIASGITPGTVYAKADGWTDGAAADTGSLAIGGGMQGSDSSAATVRGKNSVAIGAGSEVDVQNAAVDPGWNAFDSANGTAVGVGASVTGVQGTAIGYGSAAKANQTVAVGEQAKANAQYGTAVGQNAGVEALRGTALGQGASVGAGADNSIALGTGSVVFSSDIKESDKNGVLSVGKSGEERRIIHVADGIEDTDAATYGQLKKVSDQVTGLNDLAVTYTDKTKTAVNFNQAALNNVGDVNFQMKGGSRGLIASGITPGTVYAGADGWADGAAAETGSLAIGGGMQGSTSSAATVRGKNSVAIGAGAEVDVQNATVDPGWNAFDSANGTAVGVGASVTGVQGTAIGSGSAAKANQTVAVGEQAKANAQYGTAIGQNAGVEALRGTALGQGASVDAGADNSIALGYGSTVFSSDIRDSDKNGVLSIGKGGEERRIIHVADGIEDTDAVTVGQIKDWKGVDVTKGQAVQYDKDGNLNVNKGNSEFKVNDDQSSIAHGQNSVIADKDGVTISSGNNGIQVSGDKTTITGHTDIKGDLNITGNLSIGGDKIATESQIQDVAGDINGLKTIVGTETVSMKDLNGKDVTTLTGAVNANKAKIGDTAQLKDITGKENSTLTEAAVANHQAIEANTSAIEQNQRDIQSLGGSVNKLGHEVDSVGAISAALAGLHPIDDDGLSKFQLSAAMGTYDGTQALALGGFYNVSPDVRLSMGLSTNLNGGDRKMAGNVGATFLIGSGVSKSIKSTAEVNQQVEELQAANEAQQKEIDELKAQLQKLLAK